MSKLLSEWNTHVLEKEHHVLEKEHVSHEVSQKTTEIITQIRDLSYYPPLLLYHSWPSRVLAQLDIYSSW